MASLLKPWRWLKVGMRVGVDMNEPHELRTKWKSPRPMFGTVVLTPWHDHDEAKAYVGVKWDNTQYSAHNPHSSWCLNGPRTLKHADDVSQGELILKGGKMNEATDWRTRLSREDEFARLNKRKFKKGERVRVRTADLNHDRFATVVDGKVTIDSDGYRRLKIKYDDHVYTSPYWFDSGYTLRHYDEVAIQMVLPLHGGKLHEAAYNWKQDFVRNNRRFKIGDRVTVNLHGDGELKATVVGKRYRDKEGMRRLPIKYDNTRHVVNDFWVDSPCTLRFETELVQQSLPLGKQGRMNEAVIHRIPRTFKVGMTFPICYWANGTAGQGKPEMRYLEVVEVLGSEIKVHRHDPGGRVTVFHETSGRLKKLMHEYLEHYIGQTQMNLLGGKLHHESIMSFRRFIEETE